MIPPSFGERGYRASAGLVRALRSPLGGEAVADEVLEVADLLRHHVDLPGEALDVRGGAAVDVEVELAAEAVLRVLSVLAHHDHGRLDRGQHGEEQVEQD